MRSKRTQSRLPPGPTRIKSWYCSKFQLIHWFQNDAQINRRVGENEYWFFIGWFPVFGGFSTNEKTGFIFPPLTDLSEHSFEISGPNLARISWNFEWHQLFNGGWAVLDILCWFIHWLIKWLKEIRDNFRVYLECAHPAFLTTLVVLVIPCHLRTWYLLLFC